MTKLFSFTRMLLASFLTLICLAWGTPAAYAQDVEFMLSLKNNNETTFSINSGTHTLSGTIKRSAKSAAGESSGIKLAKDTAFICFELTNVPSSLKIKAMKLNAKPSSTSSTAGLAYNYETAIGTSIDVVKLTSGSFKDYGPVTINSNRITFWRNSNTNTYIASITFVLEDTRTAPSLSWDRQGTEGSVSEVTINKNVWGLDGPLPTLTNSEELPITYSSSNSNVCAIDASTGACTLGVFGTAIITARFAGNSQYRPATVSYTLTYKCQAVKPIIEVDENALLNSCNSTITLKAKKPYEDKDNPYISDTYVRWYKDGKLIPNETNHSYVVTEPGKYTASVVNGCEEFSEDTVIVTDKAIQPEVKIYSPKHFFRVNTPYTKGTDNPLRHLAAVTAGGASASDIASNTNALWQITAEVKKANASSRTAIGTIDSKNQVISGTDIHSWVYADAAHEDTILMDMRQLYAAQSANNLGLAQGDTLFLIIKARMCENDYDLKTAKTITIPVVDEKRRSIGYIVSGGDKTTVKLNGDAFTGYNKSDLKKLASKTTWTDEDEPLYAHLKERYDVMPINGYASYDRYNFDAFDVILLTDYPKTDKGTHTFEINKKDTTVKSDYFVNQLADLVDRKPIYTLKAHMSKLPAWHAKGFTSNPYTPYHTENRMKVLCYGHQMFEAMGDNAPTDDNPWMDITEGAGFDPVTSTGLGKSLQGFRMSDLDPHFIKIAAICNYGETSYLSGKPDISEPLIVCCERYYYGQPNTRIVVLSVNAQATNKINGTGLTASEVIIDYLLLDEDKHVSDCAFIFDGGTDKDHKVVNWSDPKGWRPHYNMLPPTNCVTRIATDIIVDVPTQTIGELMVLKPSLSITINPDAALSVANKITLSQDSNKYEYDVLDDPNIIILKADEAGRTGAFIHGDKEGVMQATVEYYSIANTTFRNGDEDDEILESNWQWMTTPFSGVIANDHYYGAWMYEWSNTEHDWVKEIGTYDRIIPFNAYVITQPEPRKYTMQGTLNDTKDRVIPLVFSKTKNPGDTGTDNENKEYDNGLNMIGNSWSAPINIAGFRAKDFVNADATIVILNTGCDQYGTGDVNDMTGATADNRTPGTYVSIPVNVASQLPKELQSIASMQAFQVRATKPDASITLTYDSLVRTPEGTKDNPKVVNVQPLRVNKRPGYKHEPQDNGITDKLRIDVRGSRYADYIYLFVNDSCTRGFENGWDGRKVWPNNVVSPILYVSSEDEAFSMSTQEAFTGTEFGFYAGEDSIYTLRFTYAGDSILYLRDSETNVYTLIEDSATYVFTSRTPNLQKRFSITSENGNPGETTDIIGVQTVGNQLLMYNTTGEPLTIRIFDAAGRLLEQRTTTDAQYQMPNPAQSTVLLVDLTAGQQHLVRKVVK